MNDETTTRRRECIAREAWEGKSGPWEVSLFVGFSPTGSDPTADIFVPTDRVEISPGKWVKIIGKLTPLPPPTLCVRLEARDKGGGLLGFTVTKIRCGPSDWLRPSYWIENEYDGGDEPIAATAGLILEAPA
jgi:hypothetical protein